MAEKDEQVTWYWKDNPGVIAGISRKNAGWMNADPVDLIRGKEGKDNRERFFTEIGLDSNRVILAGLKQTTNIAAVDASQAGQVFYGDGGIDGLSADTSGLILAVTVADCLPIYFYDPIARVIAIAHAGWRGVLNNIAGKMIEHLNKTYSGAGPTNLRVLIGPGLRPCHFEVRSDVEGLFKEKYSDHIDYRDGRIYIDLPAIIKSQLSRAGLMGDNVEDSGECNYDLTDRYFSFRREHPVKPQSMVAFISLRNG